ncbi:hypothetical protein FWF89_01125 [Candidatus Saccharibacteria bacterium]|nr:hypothetical protein [Candidatus Saccharibacteria bacterium]
MNILEYFSRLHKEKRELALLEWTYLVMVVISVLVAGIFALFNQALGVGILIVPLVAFIAMSMNVVAWALIKLAADTFLPKKADKKPLKKK